MPNSFAAFPDMLTSEYFYEYSEAHRRRPTIFEFPALTIHIASYFSVEGPAALKPEDAEPDEVRFLRLLRGFRGWYKWVRRPYIFDHPPEQVDDQFLEAFAQFVGSSGKEAAHDERDEVLAFECMPHIDARFALRVEVHKEYFSLTAFYGLDIEPIEDGRVVITAPELSAQFPTQVFDASALGEGANIVDQIYGPIHRRLLTYLNSPPINLGATLETLFPRCTFANFHGCALPVVAFHSDFTFPLESQSEPNRDFGGTHKLLADLWPQLRRTLFLRSDDMIACYMQNGKAIYLSSLGSQVKPRELDDLRYALIYEDEKYNEKHPDENAATTAADQLTAPQLKRQINWRMSRLMGRLHEAGTLRLAGLRKLRRLRQAMAELTSIEQEVVRKAWPSSYGFFFANRIKEVTERLFALSTIIGEPIQYRLSRSGYYFSRSQAQVKELGVVKIPAWQSYSEFLDRRLYQTYSQISGMTGRIDRVLRFLEAQSSALQNRHALLWQILAGLAALIVLPSYFGDIAQKADCDWWLGYWVGFGGLLFAGVAFWGITARQERAKERRRSDMLDQYSKQ
jgi:hypothetical protein